MSPVTSSSSSDDPSLDVLIFHDLSAAFNTMNQSYPSDHEHFITIDKFKSDSPSTSTAVQDTYLYMST